MTARTRKPRSAPLAAVGDLERTVSARASRLWAARRRTLLDDGCRTPTPSKPAGRQSTHDPDFDGHDDEDREARRVDTAHGVAARLMLAKALDGRDGLVASIRSKAPVVIIDVPDESLFGLIASSWKEVVLGSADAKSEHVGSDTMKFRMPPRDDRVMHLVVKEPPKDSSKAGRQNNALIALSLARPIIAISPVADTHLPDALLRACTTRVPVGTIDWPTIARTIRIVTGEGSKDSLEPAFLAKIGLDEIGMAVRLDRSAEDCMNELRRLASAKIARASSRELRLDDMHGMDEAVAWAKAFVRDVHAWRRGELSWNAISAGVVFDGPPGTAKSTLLRVISAETGLKLVLGNLAKWQGSGEGHLGHCLRAMAADMAECRKTATIFGCEEIDALADRVSLKHDWKDYSIQVVSAFLAGCDSLSSAHDYNGDGVAVALIGTTNDYRRCDPAILRSGRFDRVIRIGLPDHVALEKIFRVKLCGDLAREDLGDLALATLGCTGADVERMVNDARRIARQAGRDIRLDDLKHALAGDVDEPAFLRRRYAVHEASHIMVDVILHGPDGAIATMIANGRGGAASTFRIGTERTAGTYADGFRRLQVMLAGRAGEIEVFRAAGSGSGGVPGSDLHQASVLAASMIGSFGLAGPPLVYLGPARDAESLLAFGEVRSAVRRELVKAAAAATHLIAANRLALDEIAARLLADGRIDGRAVAGILTARGGAVDDGPGDILTTRKDQP